MCHDQQRVEKPGSSKLAGLGSDTWSCLLQGSAFISHTETFSSRSGRYSELCFSQLSKIWRRRRGRACVGGGGRHRERLSLIHI